MDPGEVAGAYVQRGDGLGGLRDVARHEHYGSVDLVEDGCLPVECWWVGGEGAEEDFPVDPELGFVVGVGVGDVDHHVRIGHDGCVVGHKELEVLACGVFVERFEEACQLRPTASPAAVVDGEGIDAGGFGGGDVVSIAAVGWLKGDHVVGEDERVCTAAEGSSSMVADFMVMRIADRGDWRSSKKHAGHGREEPH